MTAKGIGSKPSEREAANGRWLPTNGSAAVHKMPASQVCLMHTLTVLSRIESAVHAMGACSSLLFLRIGNGAFENMNETHAQYIHPWHPRDRQ